MYNYFYTSLIVIFCVTPSVFADTITIVNKTPIDLCGALYFVRGTAERATEPVELLAGKSTNIERPERRLGYDRVIYISPDVAALTPTLSSGESQFIPHATVGSTKGSTFYILFDNDTLHIYNTVEKAVSPLLAKLRDAQQQLTDAMLQKLQKSYLPFAHKHTTATVRTDGAIGTYEQQFLAKRKKITKKALEKIVGRSLADHEIPTIALCASGGGYRAMISFLGSVEGAKRAGLLNSVTYMAGLSGGAWGVTLSTMLDHPLNHIAQRLNTDLTTDVDTEDFLSQLWKKFIFKQSLSVVDVYGLLLVNRLLGGAYKTPMLLTLSEQAKKIQQAERPFPIYTAVVTKKPYEWVEFNPYEVRSSYLGGSVPTWAFGSSFSNGKSQSLTPEQSLGFCMGIWGSAMSANMQEIYATMRALVSSPLLLSALDAGTHEQFFGSVRVLPAKVPNFTFGIHTSPRWQQDMLTLVDAGIECNIPVPPLLGRADIIIIFDNSLDVLTSQAGELKKVEQYVTRKNIPFVSINYEHIVEKQCSVFFDRTNLKAPLIIYFPLINNVHYATRFDVQKCMEMSFCGTQNFYYSAPQIKELSGLAQFNVMENAEVIRQAIREYIQMRSGKSA